MAKSSHSRRPGAVRITLARASRLHRLLAVLAESPRKREDLTALMGVGLRTFYRELELLRRCGIKIRQGQGQYVLRTTLAEAEGRLPFPDPQLSFAEMAEIAAGPGTAASRLAELLRSVTSQTQDRPRSPRRK